MAEQYNTEHSEIFELEETYFKVHQLMPQKTKLPPPPSKSPKQKSVTFDEVVHVVQVEVHEDEEVPAAIATPNTTMLLGLLGFLLLSIYLFLLFLNGLASFIFALLTHLAFYTELALVKVWLKAFDFEQRRVVTVLCFTGAVGLSLGALVASFVVVFVASSAGVAWGLLWWGWTVGMGFVEGGERVLESWVEVG